VDKRHVEALETRLRDVQDDENLWRNAGEGLAVFASPEALARFRLPIEVPATTQVSDRYHIQPLAPLLAEPPHAIVLALAKGSVHLIEVTRSSERRLSADLPARMDDFLIRTEIREQPPVRQRGGEGEKVVLKLYVRAVAEATEALLRTRRIPLIVAATETVAAAFVGENLYRQLWPDIIAGSPEDRSDAELAEEARNLMRLRQAERWRELMARFWEARSAGKATSDLAETARAAAQGAVETLLTVPEASAPGLIDEITGDIVSAPTESAATYGLVDQITMLALAHGAEIVAAAQEQMPDRAAVAAILRYPLTSVG
jgi:hypothetical protein